MPGARHSVTPADSAITIADIVAARSDYQRTRPKSLAEATGTPRWQTWAPFPAAALLGAVFGACLPPGDHGLWLRFSNALGWGYALSWAIAEYPALYLNWRQRETVEASLDSLVYRLTGNAAYTAFTLALLATRVCSPSSKEGCGAKAESVHLNDVFFSMHSTVCSLGLIYQLVAYSPRRVAPSLQFWVVFVSAFSVAVGCLILALQDSSYLSVPNYLYGLSFLRIGSCILEHLPGSGRGQQKKMGDPGTLKASLATSVAGVLCLGGVLSLAQQILDASATHSPGVITGNLTKAALAILTLGFAAWSLRPAASGDAAAVPGVRARDAGRSAGVAGSAQEGADEARGDELMEALLSVEEGSRPMVKTTHNKNSLRTLAT